MVKEIHMKNITEKNDNKVLNTSQIISKNKNGYNNYNSNSNFSKTEGGSGCCG